MKILEPIWYENFFFYENRFRIPIILNEFLDKPFDPYINNDNPKTPANLLYVKFRVQDQDFMNVVINNVKREIIN